MLDWNNGEISTCIRKLEIVFMKQSPTMGLSIRMISPGNLLTILYQLTISEAISPNGFWDIFITSFLCLNLQRAITRKNAKDKI